MTKNFSSEEKLKTFDEFFAEKSQIDAEREKMIEELRNKNEEIEEAKLEALKEAIFHRNT